jgi:ABC-type transport system substrate-binding protein
MKQETNDFGRSMKRLIRPLGLVLLIAGFTPAAPGQKKEVEQPKSGGILRVKAFAPQFNQNLDPVEPAHYFVLEQIYEGLVRFDHEMNVIPALAEYWIVSDGGTKITFYLRRDVRFHHGAEFTSEDVRFSLERLIRRASSDRTHAYFLDKVEGAADYYEGRSGRVTGFLTPDRHTFEIIWKRPYVSGLYLLAMYTCKILPRDLVLDQGRSFFQKPSGTGAFRFSHWMRSPRLDIVGVCLERNPDYHGKTPYLNELEYSPYFTLDQFESGDVHLTPLIHERLLRDRYAVLENVSVRSAFLGISGDIPPMDDPRVRQALAIGLDKGGIAQAAYDTANVPQVAKGFLPPGLPGFFPLGDDPPPDLYKARALLRQAGIPSGPNPFKMAYGVVMPVTDFQIRIHRELRRQLAELGIDLEMVSLKTPEDFRTLSVPFLSLVQWQMDIPDPEDLIAPLFQSRSEMNARHFRYANPRLDRLLELSEGETSWRQRTRIFREMELLLLEEMPAVPLYTMKLRVALQPFVRGVRAPALGFYFMDLKNVWLDR